MKSTFSWISSDKARRFGGMYPFYYKRTKSKPRNIQTNRKPCIHSPSISDGYLLGLYFDLNMETIFSSETSGYLYTERRYNPDTCALQ